MLLLFQWLRVYLTQNRYYIGLFFALFIAIGSVITYKLYIKNYYFVTPSSNELLGLSAIAFLVSLHMVYKRYFVEQNVITTHGILNSIISSNISLYAKVPYMIASVVGIIALIVSIIAESPMLEKHSGTTALKISILLSALCCLHLYWLKISLYHNFYNHIATNKKEFTIYTLLTVPYLVLVITIIPGATSPDQSTMLSEAIDGWPIQNWHPVFVIMLLRLFHFFPYESGHYLFLALFVYLPSTYFFSLLFRKRYVKYVVFCIFLYSSSLNQLLYQIPKNIDVCSFIYASVIALLYYVKIKQKQKYIIISIILLAFATYSRHNQITQVVILLIPLIFVILKQYINKIKIKHVAYSMLLLLILIEIPNKFIFNNPHLIQKTYPQQCLYDTDQVYFAFRLENLSTLPKQIQESDHIKQAYEAYINAYRKDPLTTNPITYISYILYNWETNNIVWTGGGLWKGGWLVTDDINHEIDGGLSRWIVLSLDNFGLFMEHRYYIFKNFLDSGTWTGYLKPYWYIGKVEYPFYGSFLSRKIIAYYESKIFEPFHYNIIFITYLILLILSFLMNGYKLFPNINIQNKNITLVYYITLSNLALFIPLIIITWTGYDNKYLLTTYLLTGIALMLFLQELPRYLHYYNKCITRFVQNRFEKTT